ncbi:MAG TPA: hypothetical protein DEQ47_09660 [Solibacterales bacterium]|nr:hypothetical protein [Bryobacterales bacterium]
MIAAPISVLSAATAGIGIATSDGTLTINNARTAGNATLFEGNTIETGNASSRLQLNSGASLQLSSDARGTVYGDRLVLEKGATQVGGSSYEVNARTLHIVGSDARVSVFGKTVEVAALSTPVRVSNAQGVLVANLEPGKALDFTPLQDAGAQAATTTTTTTETKTKHKHVGGGEGNYHVAIVAGVIVAAAVGVTAGVLATQSSGGGTCLSGCK